MDPPIAIWATCRHYLDIFFIVFDRNVNYHGGVKIVPMLESILGACKGGLAGNLDFTYLIIKIPCQFNDTKKNCSYISISV